MKRILASLLILIMVLPLLFACGGADGKADAGVKNGVFGFADDFFSSDREQQHCCRQGEKYFFHLDLFVL